MGVLSAFRKNKLVTMLERIINRDTSVLDIGCADGTLLRALNVDGVGADLHFSSRPPEDGRNKYLQCNAADSLPFGPEVFDYCILSHIIEHLSPSAVMSVLKECRRVLKPHGQIVVLTPMPSADSPLKFLSNLRFIGEFDHTIYFTPKGLANVCEETGFKNVSLRRYNFGLDIIYVGKK